MKHLDGILEMVDMELGSIAKNGQFRSKDEVHSVYELIDIAKDVYCIWEYEEGGSEGYSEMYPMYRSENYGSYDGGGSYARGRGRNAKRDSMGRYSRDAGNYRGGSYRGSYDGNYDGESYRGGNYRRGGYSRDDAKEEYIEHLRETMENAPDEKTRMSIQRMIEQMERE